MTWRRTMPFGQHKGYAIADLPDSYIEWLTSIELHGWLHDAVHDEYHRRQADREYRTPQPPAGPGIRIRPEEVPLARRVFDAGYRILARSMHPDVGGDPDEMCRLNGLAESLRSQLASIAEGAR